MVVDIRTFDILYLHGPHRPERKDHMEKHLRENGLTAECHVGVSDKGSSSGALGMIDIMKKRLEGDFKPFILLEDDCSPTQWFRHDVPLPDDADALYLGLSAYGLNAQQDLGILHVDYTEVPYEPDIVRIFNMLSNHAIMFVTKRWTENCLECFKKTLLCECDIKRRSYDIEQCKTIPNFNVYGLRKPLFFQDDRVGGQTRATYIMFQ